RPFLWMRIHFPQPPWKLDPAVSVRRARILARAEAIVKGEICLVAGSGHAHQGLGSLRSTTAHGRRRRFAGTCRADVAAIARKVNRKHSLPLAFQEKQVHNAGRWFDSGIVAGT